MKYHARVRYDTNRCLETHVFVIRLLSTISDTIIINSSDIMVCTFVIAFYNTFLNHTHGSLFMFCYAMVLNYFTYIL